MSPVCPREEMEKAETRDRQTERVREGRKEAISGEMTPKKKKGSGAGMVAIVGGEVSERDFHH